MRMLFLAAVAAAAPTLALSQWGAGGTGRGDCDYIVNNPNRPDCLGYNPFHPQAAYYAALARRKRPVLYDPFGLSPPQPAFRPPHW